ncbi:DUF3027 domain-containing protein [Nocardia beijingensis]|uniref:DUF3027 domain-containing protein n=1 Tax=Nocardia beijingensis TaxID=95162 RepID=UPI003D9F1C89
MSAVSVSESGVRPILADAVDLARRALLELEPSAVGAHLGVIAEDESAATHRFEATLPGYRGWQWAVVVAAPPGADRATVSESALLPGPDALVAPEFVPWEQRVRPGDLAPGDLLAPPADDPRLVPGYVATGDPVVDEVAYEVGLGRTKVMSREGRAEAAERWYSEYGPDSEMAKAAPATCGSCGFYLPLAGSLRAAFGVCGNAMGADGHVVHVAYGCGAHSDTEVPTGNGSPMYEAYDDSAIEVITLRTDEPRDGKREQAEEAPSEDVDRHGAAEQAEGAARTGDRRPEAEVADATARAEEAAATETEAVAIPAAEVGEIDGPALGTGDAGVPAVAGSDAVPAASADAQSADAAPNTAVEPESRAVATEPESHASSSATSPAEPSVASSVTGPGVGQAEGTAASVSDESAGSATSEPTEADAAGSTSSAAPSSGASTDLGESNAVGTSATESDTASSATESVAAAGSEAVPTGAAESAPVEAVAAESAPASDAVARAHESASSPTPGPEPTATPAGAEDVDAPSGAGVAEGEARPEFQSSPRS